MKAKIIFFILGIILVSSCTKADLVDDLIQTETVDVVSTTETKGWSYVTNTWSTKGGVMYNKLYNAYGTNQTTKKAVFTVTNNSSSADKIYVTIYAATSSGTQPLSLYTFWVSKGYNVTQIVDVTGLPTNLTHLRLVIQPNTSSGSYSGVTTYGYEQ